MAVKKAPSFRHELKYYISNGEYQILSKKLSLTMDRDKFAQKTGRYMIRSLYFDDFDDSALREKLDGVGGRDKYRIRIYNLADSTIKLERKHKEGQYILKHSLSLSREECDNIIHGNYGVLLSRPEDFAKQLYVAFRTQGLKPKVIVDYYREAYVFPTEQVRVTFDSDIRTAFRAVDLFNPHLPTCPVVEGFDMVLEIKFNKYLPAYIQSLVQVAAAERSAISKYCLCRKFEF